MNPSKKQQLEKVEELRRLIEENSGEDGSFRFDALRAIVALEFAQTEIEKSISK